MMSNQFQGLWKNTVLGRLKIWGGINKIKFILFPSWRRWRMMECTGYPLFILVLQRLYKISPDTFIQVIFDAHSNIMISQVLDSTLLVM